MIVYIVTGFLFYRLTLTHTQGHNFGKREAKIKKKNVIKQTGLSNATAVTGFQFIIKTTINKTQTDKLISHSPVFLLSILVKAHLHLLLRLKYRPLESTFLIYRRMTLTALCYEGIWLAECGSIFSLREMWHCK